MKEMKRFCNNSPLRATAFALATALVLSILPAGAYAANTPGSDASSQTPSSSASANRADAVAMTVYTNGVVYTVEGENWDRNAEESVAVSADGVILHVGSNEEALAFADDDTSVVDLNGATVLPGLLDGHVHPPGTALTEMYNIYLYESVTRESALATIREYIEANPDLDSYWGSGFTMGLGGADAEGKGPKKEWLDEICADKPIILSSNDGHNRWLNSIALEMNDITESTVHPTGTIQKSSDGELWGVLTDASDLITMTQTFTDEQNLNALRKFQENMLAWGYTGGHMLLSGEKYADYFETLEEDGAWTMRSNLSFRFDPENAFADDVAGLKRVRDLFEDNKLISLKTAKFFADGVIEGMTGYLSTPYDAAAGLAKDYVSVPLWNADDLKTHFTALNKEGVQIHVHSIGDQATTEVVDAMEAAQSANPDFDARNTITHLQVVKDADKIRMGDLGIIGSTQPFWHFKEPEWFEYVDAVALGQERAWKEYPVKSLADEGVVMTFSGDHPVSPVNNPFWAIEAAVTRNLNNPDYYGVDDITDIDDPAWLLNPDERISVKQAIEAYSINTAYQLFLEESIGSLAAGKSADMIIVDQDPLKVDPLYIDETKVIETVFAGKTVYKSEDDDTSNTGDGEGESPVEGDGEGPSTEDGASAEVFSDIAGHWAQTDINFVSEQGYFGGIGGGMFDPNGGMSRAMLVTALGRAAGIDADEFRALAESSELFSDVAATSWYAPYVAWAVSSGVTEGIGGGMFAPNAFVTREQTARFLASFIENSGFSDEGRDRTVDELWLLITADDSADAFTDQTDISGWAIDPILKFRTLGIINGYPDGTFSPDGEVTRAEAASMLAGVAYMGSLSNRR